MVIFCIKIIRILVHFSSYFAAVVIRCWALDKGPSGTLQPHPLLCVMILNGRHRNVIQMKFCTHRHKALQPERQKAVRNTQGWSCRPSEHLPMVAVRVPLDYQPDGIWNLHGNKSWSYPETALDLANGAECGWHHFLHLRLGLNGQGKAS